MPPAWFLLKLYFGEYLSIIIAIFAIFGILSECQLYWYLEKVDSKGIGYMVAIIGRIVNLLPPTQVSTRYAIRHDLI
jgi:hypothetical protein